MNKEIHKQGFKVALTGEGVDECFLGYSHLLCDYIENYAPNDKSLSEVVANNSFLAGTELPDGETLDLDDLKKRIGVVPTFLKGKASIGAKMRTLMDNSFLKDCHPSDVFEKLFHLTYNTDFSFWNKVNKSAYLWNKTALPNYILKTLGDGCEMASSIEGRLPFLDHRLFECVMRIPMNVKFKNGIEKYILREAVKPYVTERVYKRRKHSFQAPPLTMMFSDKVYNEIEDRLASGESIFFSKNKIWKRMKWLRRASKREQIAWEPVIMLLLTLDMLYENYMLNKRYLQ